MQQTVRVAAAQAESAWRRASCAASSPSCRPGSSASWPGWPAPASTASPNSPRCSPSPAPPCTAHSSAASPTRRADSQPADQHVGFPMPPQPAPEPTASTDRTRAVPEGAEHHRGRGNGGTHPCGQPGQRCTLLCMSQAHKRKEVSERSRPGRAGPHQAAGRSRPLAARRFRKQQAAAFLANVSHEIPRPGRRIRSVCRRTAPCLLQ